MTTPAPSHSAQVAEMPSTTEKHDWMPEARQMAAQCWCDDETKHLVMEPALAESIARRISSWMQTGAQHAGNEEYWRDRAKKAESARLAPVVAEPVAMSRLNVNEADKYWCETCNGSGHIDETLGGEWNSNPKATCPDCDGKGYWIPRAAAQPSPTLPAQQMAYLLSSFERAVERKQELFSECQGKGWPDDKSATFTTLRDEKIPALRKQILSAGPLLPAPEGVSDLSQPERNEILHRMVEGLHAMVFGVYSIKSGDFALTALGDGGQIHEYVHSMIRLLPARCHEQIDAAALATPQPPAAPTEPDLIALATIAVDGYNASAVDGCKIPHFTKLLMSERLFWMAAAEAVYVAAISQQSEELGHEELADRINERNSGKQYGFVRADKPQQSEHGGQVAVELENVEHKFRNLHGVSVVDGWRRISPEGLALSLSGLSDYNLPKSRTLTGEGAASCSCCGASKREIVDWNLLSLCRECIAAALNPVQQPVAQPHNHEIEGIGVNWRRGLDEGPIPVLYTAMIDGDQVCRDDVWLTTTSRLATPAPAAQATGFEESMK